MRYFFHLHDPAGQILDEEGRDIELVSAIAPTALAEVRALISQDALDGFINLDQHLDVEDVFCNVVHSLPFANAIGIALPAR